MKSFYEHILELDPLKMTLAALDENAAAVTVAGMTGSLTAAVAAACLTAAKRPVLHVVPTARDAEVALDDLTTYLGQSLVGYLPPLNSHPYDTAPLASGPRNERADALLRCTAESPSVIVTLPEALLEPAPSLEWLSMCTLRLNLGARIKRSGLLKDLAAAEFQRTAMVDAQGQFSVRGALVDLFPFGHETPVRIEFDGDAIHSMRWFDPVSQRSTTRAEEVVLLLEQSLDSTGGGGVLDLMPPDAVVIWADEPAIEARLEDNRKRISQAHKMGAAKPSKLNGRGVNLADLRRSAADKRQCKAVGFSDRAADVDFHSRRPPPSPEGLDELNRYLERIHKKCRHVWITADTDGERNRLEELFHDEGVLGVNLTVPALSEGFLIEPAKLAVLTSHELFQRRRLKARHTRFRRRAVKFDRDSLRRGDYVVHAEYGIGRYEGLQMVKVNGQPRESLRICYQDDVILYIPVENFSQVERYIGSQEGRPTLSKIGGGEWARAKKRAQKAARDIADELVKLYAQRRIVQGTAFSPDTRWQQEMEASFEFEDTPDQALATVEIKKDLEAEYPMDRLLCGDVGFGKTEVALRAAFKVVQDSCQVAVLVPTTVLAQQHYETFRERLAPYPVKIEVLSRFRSKAEQKSTIARLKEGATDIVIGTHRLISQDVGFKRLGLLIIDEEHRFGVKHKERIKQMRTNVDVLTMTATPIPRTLHMALMGARDTSQINTPPMDRLPVQTEVHSWSEELIRDAILREIDRQGQVFFVHNRVESIHSVKGMLDRLAPGARIAVAHGQMHERDLERIMFDFMHGRHDVLVVTMIIESGLDIPNANTLIVNRADRLGLAQLYQLRGRIGRSNRQAYAYFLTPPKLTLTPEAKRRLATMVDLTELGSGLKVAMRDLEIRGAGNMLGHQQSGFINAIGFDLYTKMLDEAVREAKLDGALTVDADEEPQEARVDFNGPALLPASYIEDGDLRYWFYRRLAESRDAGEVDKIAVELDDRFGKLPNEARNLLDLTQLKLMSKALRFNRLDIGRTNLTASLQIPSENARAQSFIGKLVALAEPFEIEFRTNGGVQLTYRFKSEDPLREARSFLRHVSREGILRD